MIGKIAYQCVLFSNKEYVCKYFLFNVEFELKKLP